MLQLNRIGNEVFYENKKLTIVAQATKGPGKEVVKIEGLPESNGQKWVALSKLKEGLNELECQGREVTSSGGGRSYILTEEEQKRVNELKAEMDSIIEAAKARFVKRPKLLGMTPGQMLLAVSKMTDEEKKAAVQELEAWLAAQK